MSIRCVSWALNDAPVEEPVQVLVLVAMAERANDDGTVSYQSKATIAQKARVSVRTVHRVMAQLEGLGVISRGDQRHVDHLPQNRRPVVYDLSVALHRDDKLSPQKSGVTQMAGVTTEVVRDDIDDTLGVTQMADNTSFESSLIDSSSSRPKHQRKRWSPSDAAYQTAVDEVIHYLSKDDLPTITIRYEVWCHDKKRQMKSSEWLQWVIRDEKEAKQQKMKETAEKQKSTAWHYVDA